MSSAGPASLHRGDFLVGVAAGLGIGERGPAVQARIGYALSSRLALSLEVIVWGEADEDFGSLDGDEVEAEADSLVIAGPGAQLWLSRRLWAKATVGGAAVTLSRPPPGQGGLNLSGLGVAAAVGVDLFSTQTGTLDLRLESIAGLFDEGSSGRVMGMVGVTFF